MARLPIPGSDSGNWGSILNTYLSQSHNDDGTLKADAVTASSLKNGSVNTVAIQDYSVTSSKLSASSLGGANGQVLVKDATVLGGVKWDVVSTGSSAPTGAAGGDLGGTYPNPTVPALANKANVTHTHVVGDVTGLQTALDGKQPVGSYATSSALTTGLAAKANTTDLSVVATSGSYADLINRPTLSTVAASGSYADLVNKPTFSAVATTGSYADLINKPAAIAQFNPIAGTNVTLTGTYPDITISATPGAGVTDLSVTRDNLSVTVVSSTGADAVLPAASSTNAGILVAADKSKLDGIAAGAQVNVNSDWNAVSGATQILNKPSLSTVATSGSYTDLINKPAAIAQFNPIAGTNVSLTGTYPNITFSATPGAGVTDLSMTRDSVSVTVASSTGLDAVLPAASATNAGVLVAADKSKLDGIATGAQVNVNADWNAASGAAQIMNKPALGTAALADTTAFATAAQGAKADTAVQPQDLTNTSPVYVWRYASGVWPALPGTKPANVTTVWAQGPSQPTAGSLPAWVGLAAGQATLFYQYAPLT